MFEPYLTCLYESVYVALKAHGFKNALQSVISPLGFSFEGNIRSRGWMLCGQSDVEYYQPTFNCGVTAKWHALEKEQFHDYLSYQILKENKYVILETEPLFIPYYEELGLGAGMPHTFVIGGIDREEKTLRVYDKLASDKKIKREANGFFKVKWDIFNRAIEEFLYVLDYNISPEVEVSWEEELGILCQKSLDNMLRVVSRESLNFQAFGLQGLKLLSKTLRVFEETYHDDALSIWLLTNRIPLNIRQSVYGNRILFHQAIKQHPELSRLESPLKNILKGWMNVRRAFISAGNREINYCELADCIENIHNDELSFTEELKAFLR